MKRTKIRSLGILIILSACAPIGNGTYEFAESNQFLTYQLVYEVHKVDPTNHSAAIVDTVRVYDNEALPLREYPTSFPPEEPITLDEWRPTNREALLGLVNTIEDFYTSNQLAPGHSMIGTICWPDLSYKGSEWYVVSS